MSASQIRDRAHNTVLQPAGWPRPKGFANGIMARGDLVFVGGMVGNDTAGQFPEGFVAQTRQALENIAAVLAEGGA
ncbi:MAG: RidA family protein, partial [Xanthobacteraceae bacterium]